MAATLRHRKGRPGLMYHMKLPLYVSCGSKQRGTNALKRGARTRVCGVRTPRQDLGESKNQIQFTPTPRLLPRRKTALADVRH